MNILGLILVVAGCNAAPLKRWGGGFEIHVFQVGQGHSQVRMIVFPRSFSSRKKEQPFETSNPERSHVRF